jgi:hypothetical protein
MCVWGCSCKNQGVIKIGQFLLRSWVMACPAELWSN